MSFRFDSFHGTSRTFQLRDGQRPIVLEADGVVHPRSHRSAAQVLTRYEDLTHLATSARAIWIGARDSVYALPRAIFSEYDAPERLVEALLGQIRDLPDGERQLAKMARVEEIGRNALVPRATWMLTAACFIVYLLQLTMGYRISMAGHFSKALVADGDLWRILTANFLHAEPAAIGIVHLGMNLLALMVLGTVLERAVGSMRTVCVMGASAVGSMLTSGLFGNIPVVGASGIVFGLLGGVLWLEYRHTEELPAWWRLPRRSVVILLIINAVIGLLVPFIAFAAHAGGLLVGAIMTAAVTRGILLRPPLWVKGLCAAVLLMTTLSVGTASMVAFAEGEARARFLERLASLPEISPGELNDLAWTIATSTAPTETELEVALQLAERAVDETERSEATILDTLAEVQFALGQTLNAIATIDEAIAHDPEDGYYREQRKRFSGERDPNDRPQYVPPMFRDPGGIRQQELPQTEPGLTV